MKKISFEDIILQNAINLTHEVTEIFRKLLSNTNIQNFKSNKI
ncbi:MULTISPECIES: hypothetical protein [Thermoanaerobacter]|nr:MULTISPECIES: hypothetical protein [Thermoanaerobacter]